MISLDERPKVHVRAGYLLWSDPLKVSGETPGTNKESILVLGRSVLEVFFLVDSRSTVEYSRVLE
jgi:hypothetical protein